MKKKNIILTLLLIIVIIAVVIIGVIRIKTIQKGKTNQNENNITNESSQGGIVTNNPSPDDSLNGNANEEPVQINYDLLEDGTKVNNSSKVKEDKMYNGLKFSNIQLTENSDFTSLTADVTNTTTLATNNYTMVDLTFYDEKGNVITSTLGLVKPLAPGETTQLNASLTLDYANAYDLKITEHKSN